MSSPKPFEYQLSFLKTMGYSLEYEHNWKGKLLKVWAGTVLFCLVIGIMTGLHSFIANINNISVFTASLASTLNWSMCLIRIGVFYFYRNRLRVLMDNIWQKTEEMHKFAAEKFQKTTRKSFLVCRFDLMLGTLSFINLIVKTIVEIFVKRERTLPFKISFFFDLTQPIIFEIFFLITCTLSACIILISAGPPCLLYAISNHIKIHYQIIGHQIKTMKMDQSVPQINSELRAVLKYQQTIESWIKELHEIYYPISNAMSFYYAWLICMTGFQVVVNTGLARRIQQFNYVSAVIFTLYLYMLAGDQISNEGSSLIDAVYGCDWYNAPLAVRRDLMFMIQRAQKSLEFRAAFFHISINTFANVMNASRSYVTLLMNFVK